MHWPRTNQLFEGEKIVISKWPASNDFGYSTGEYYSDANTYLIKIRPNVSLSLKYILGILNSKVFRFYFDHKASKRGDKYFFPKEFCEKLPVKPIHSKEEKKSHDEIVDLVDQMIQKRQKLLELSPYLANKLYVNLKYFDDEVPDLDEKSIVHALGWSAARPLNRHDGVKYSLGTISADDFTLNSVKMIAATLFEERPTLRLVAVDNLVVEFQAEKEILVLLQTLLSEYKGRSLSDILRNVELPVASSTLAKKNKEILQSIKEVTHDITAIQDRIDQRAMLLYGVKL